MMIKADSLLGRGVVLIAIAVLGVGTGVLVGNVRGARAGTCDPEAVWNGSSGADTKYDTDDGQDEENQWFANGGQDFLRALACNDIDVKGNGENDDLGGGSGTDNVAGQDGRDDIFGGAGTDDMTGGDGDDQFADVEVDDYDSAYGNQQDDDIDLRDSDGNDLLVGGPGTDYCRSNTGDVEDSSCELG